MEAARFGDELPSPRFVRSRTFSVRMDRIRKEQQDKKGAQPAGASSVKPATVPNLWLPVEGETPRG